MKKDTAKPFDQTFLKFVIAIVMMMLMVLGALCTTASAGDYGAGCPFSNWYNGTVHGGIYIDVKGHYDNAGATQTEIFENVPDGRKIVRLYPGIWLGSPSSGRVTYWNITINGHTDAYKFIEPEGLPEIPFCDYEAIPVGDTPEGTGCKVSCTGCGQCFVTYNASSYIVTGDNTITFWTSEQIDQFALLVVYENESMPEMQYWIKEGHEYPDMDSAPYFVYFNETLNTGPIDPDNISSVEYFTYGYPHCVGESGWPYLNGNYIGAPNITYEHAPWVVFYHWTNIPPSYITSSSNQFRYPTLGNDRLMVPVLVLKYGTPELPDLVITDKWVCWPDNCTICYNLTNAGNGTAAPGHNTTLYVNGVETAQDKVPVELAPGESYVGCFESYPWVYTPPDDNITVCADKNETVTESDEENNCLTNTWECGDVNNDKAVNILDVIQAYNKTPGINEWAADVNADRAINILDVIKIYTKSGLKCCCD